jgi:apolipoprotein N-acyltransferase
MKKNSLTFSFIVLILGIGLYTLVTWKWNVAIAAWLAPIFLVRYFRTQSRWVTTLPAVLLLWAASYANKVGAWGMDPFLEVVLLGIAAIPMIIALYLDRFTSSRLHAFWSTLVFPAAFVALDYGISFLPIGTSLSLSGSQFYMQPLMQIATITGVWGIEFIVLWAAPVINALWENGFDIRAVRIPAAVYVLCLTGVLLYGGLRIVFARPVTTTVRVAGVTVAHARNYWDAIIDKGTPQEQVRALMPEIQELEDQLFLESENAVRSGAKVIFWSEADAFILPEQKETFLQRARSFAKQHQVYFMPAFQILRYGDISGFNGLVMITPQGELAYEYEKTMSWYATTSDGKLHSVDTPYGQIGAAICFDMDFPELIRQAAQQKVDILLVPAFDTYQTRVYHTEVGLARGVEDGFSIMRMVNEGTSMAIDYRGHLLASQDFFTSPSRILIADLPTRGVVTLYGKLGDWFAWLNIILVIASILKAVILRPSVRLQTRPDLQSR